MATDTERLEFLMHSGAHIAFSKDGEDCWLHWAYNPWDEEGGPVNQAGIFDSPRKAIDSALENERTDVKIPFRASER